MSNINRVINICPEKLNVIVYASAAQDEIVDVIPVAWFSKYANPSKKVVEHARETYPEATVHIELKAWVKEQQKWGNTMIDFEKYLEGMRAYPQVDNLFEDEADHMWVAELTTGEEMLLQYMWNGKIKVTALVDDKVDSWFSKGDWLNDITKVCELGE